MIVTNIFVILSWILLELVLCKDVSENERAVRAAFIQRLLNKQKSMDGRIKLVSGSTKFEGNVYIYHAGRWGAICDDSWDDAAAQVVCRTFNRSGVATHGGQFGEALAKYWMDDVVCKGDETNLAQCIFTGWGSSDCEPGEAAGVKCVQNDDELFLAVSPPKRIRLKHLYDILDVKTASLRLVGGKNNNEGRVEVYHNKSWGSICPDGWTLYEAAAVCKHLALGYAAQALQTSYFGSSPIIVSGVQCQGNETNLFGCKHMEFGDVVCPGKTGFCNFSRCIPNLTCACIMLQK